MYRKKRAVAVLMCATFALVAAAPLVQSDGETVHLIYKDENGPPSTCALTWEFVAPSDGTWSAHVVNEGMRWIILDMIDTDTSEVLIDRDMYRWALYPEGWFDTEPLAVTGGHLYSITGTPNGPLYTSMTVTDVFTPDVVLEPPVALFTVSVDYLEVSVDASASYDNDGTIVDYDWDFGDTSTASGMTATHTYAADGTYVITLTVEDDDGLTATTTETVVVEHMPVPPVAAFTVTVDGLTVNVDASESEDPDGTIVSWEWDWGDGTTGSGEIASHTYTPPPAAAPAASPTLGIPPPPYVIYGWTYDSSAAILPDCVVTVTNVRLGMSTTVMSDATGMYNCDLNAIGGEDNPYVNGDEILVEAEKGALYGSATIFVDMAIPYIQVDLVLEGETPEPFDVTITLTVTDDDGLTTTVSHTVTVQP